MAELLQTQHVQLFRGTYRHVEGALENQRSFLRQHPRESIVTESVNDSTILALHAARRDAVPAISAPLPDAVHAIEGLRRQAKSLIITSETDRSELHAEIARIRANGLRALANMMVNDVMAVYVLAPETQNELLAPLESMVER